MAPIHTDESDGPVAAAFAGAQQRCLMGAGVAGKGAQRRNGRAFAYEGEADIEILLAARAIIQMQKEIDARLLQKPVSRTLIETRVGGYERRITRPRGSSRRSDITSNRRFR